MGLLTKAIQKKPVNVGCVQLKHVSRHFGFYRSRFSDILDCAHQVRPNPTIK
jgi:hypothetical protein